MSKTEAKVQQQTQNMTEQEALIEHLFTYHAPTASQKAQLEAVRAKAKEFAEVMLRNTPKSADQSAALRKLRECVMAANASIVLGGLS
jgi:hypothetical protein